MVLFSQSVYIPNEFCNGQCLIDTVRVVPYCETVMYIFTSFIISVLEVGVSSSLHPVVDLPQGGKLLAFMVAPAQRSRLPTKCTNQNT